ncbi:hypothetical protein [Chryseobacterium indologenes]|uniref:SRPBCC family protein n=1 Tax=Chryseobacterium indologenes TaxID=253 RepID=A0A0N0IY82_CHRID|nr:hypothetical protein [Chryseobacterium indologenes]KPE52872.1 hypothetical protein AOB46_02460 [Chryseobacterium indologenes]
MTKLFEKHLYLLVFTIIALIIIAWFLLIENGSYGITLFLTIPITIGFIIGYLSYFKDFSIRKILTIGGKIAGGLLIISVILIVCGIEGAICIIMALPFIAFAILVGYSVGLILGNLDKSRYTGSVLLFFLIINPASYIFDTYAEPIQDTVTTEMIVNAPSEKVWQLLSTEIKFSKPDFVLFEKGVSYPQSIKLTEHNGRSFYTCTTNNDKINLNIDEFTDNKKVKFSLENQTVPMKEVSPYDEIDAKHLHEYFIVNYGEISLEKLSENKTKITAKTQYSYKIAPKWYWKKWSNYILDKMQGHVLNSIKNQTEHD